MTVPPTPPNSSSNTGAPGTPLQQTVQSVITAHQQTAEQRAAAQLLGSLVQLDQYVGEVYSLGYETALTIIHDSYRQRVGGIPSVSFLIATRINPAAAIDHTAEDSSVILLRVMESAALPNEQEAQRIRAETAQRVTGEENTMWDAPHIMDAPTANLLSFAGVKCRIIGTFYLEPETRQGAPLPLRLRFGSDISNYYPNRGLKVYRPNGAALERIVNYRDPLRETTSDAVRIGAIRYASTSRAFQGIDVPVSILPEDLLGQKTALFGMTRVGKSNTTKIIARSVFELRFGANGRRVGQIIFDPNGEYANENVQDAGALKNLWQRADGRGDPADVLTYGTLQNPNDPHRRMMMLNFYETNNLQIGKEFIDNVLSAYTTIYTTNFRQVEFGARPTQPGSAQIRHDRRVLVYRALLAKAGFALPPNFQPNLQRLFGADLIAALQNSQSANAADYQALAQTLTRPNPSWDQLAQAFQHLDAFIKDAEYGVFNTAYMARAGGTGDAWADEDLKKILGMFGYPNGSRLIGGAQALHHPRQNSDYSVDIYDAVAAGRLVIIDQSGGDEAVNKAGADRIMEYIFDRNRQVFRSAESPPHILLYLEEAHNILPAAADLDLDNIWVRSAKEGAKYHLGIVYATQEVSSIQRNILKNTSNWFIGHLNNTDETKELVKYYDFADFEPSIRRAQDRGFLRVKTLSNLFVIPVQIDRFVV